MPIAAAISQNDHQTDGNYTVPVSIASPWNTVIPAGSADDADNAGSDVTNVDTQGAASTGTRVPILRRGRGTYVALRLGYATAPTTFPVLQVFGRTTGGSGQVWERLADSTGTTDISFSATLATTDGTTTYTTSSNPIDCRGCNEIIVMVKTAAAGGGAAGVFVQAKIY